MVNSCNYLFIYAVMRRLQQLLASYIQTVEVNCEPAVYFANMLGGWFGVVVSTLASINEVNLRRARLVLR